MPVPEEDGTKKELATAVSMLAGYHREGVNMSILF